MGDVELAQVNVARPLEPLSSRRLIGFVRMLEPVYAVADRAPGFVWRLKDDDTPLLGDGSLIVTLSVWESVEHLRDFVYGGLHAEVMSRRRRWFEHLAEAYLVAWWIPAGHRPTVTEAGERLRWYRENGASPTAFPLHRPFPPERGVTLRS